MKAARRSGYILKARQILHKSKPKIADQFWRTTSKNIARIAKLPYPNCNVRWAGQVSMSGRLVVQVHVGCCLHCQVCRSIKYIGQVGRSGGWVCHVDRNNKSNRSWRFENYIVSIPAHCAQYAKPWICAHYTPIQGFAYCAQCAGILII